MAIVRRPSVSATGHPSRPRAFGHGALFVPAHSLRHASAALRLGNATMAYAAVRGYLGLFAAVLRTFRGSSIEMFYNRVRRHSHLGGVSPEAFEAASPTGSGVS